MRHNATHSFTFLIALLCITFLSITSLAQNTSPLKVIEFRMIPNGTMDELRLEEKERTDYDDNPVCEIQVKAQGFDEEVMQRFKFLANGPFITKVEFDDAKNEWRIYLSSNRRGSLTIKYQGECVYEFPSKLEPKKIYELILGMETATLVIRATPEESVIYVDDEKVGTGNVSHAVSVGAEHRYRVECENYFEREDVVMLQKGERKSLNIELEPAFGFITVKTTPSGADVYVDDKLVGKTPYLSEVIKRGMHKITVNKEGYETTVQRVNINVNEESNVEFELVEGESSMPVQKVVPTGGSAVQAVNTIDGHEYVDLGLPSGTLWATCNVGASRPEDYGSYYAWGETTNKGTYDWTTYKWCRGSKKTLTKYNTESGYGIVDNRTTLEPADDAAHANWGDDWRMPTKDDWQELKDNCTWMWTTQGGKAGYCVTGPNSKSIFLPATGYYGDGSFNNAGSVGYYWSSSLDAGGPGKAYLLYFSSVGVYMDGARRNYGRSVRPVSAPQD